MIFNVLLIVFAVIVFIQFLYFIVVFGKFSFGKNAEGTPTQIPISVIVCAKNEAENIKKYFHTLVSQNYSNYEIVLIDDASSDETLEIFEEYEKRYSNVKLVKVQNNEAFWGNKKWALTLGIKAAKNEYLIFIDADCYPASNNWLMHISSQFSKEKTIVLGYGAYLKNKNSLLNKLIRFDMVFTASQYFSWAKIGKPFMGIGRNLAYKKEEFFKARGFQNHMKIRSGDDDLFINQVANKKNTATLYLPESFTLSEPKKTFKSWFYQKRRQANTTNFYKTFDKFQLRLFFFTQLSFLVLAIILLAFQFEWIIVTGIIAFRYLFTWISIGYAATKLNEKDVLYWYPIFEILLIFTQLSVFFRNLISKPVHWK
jgi:cellulose synthase/poly-beta-1,6-N-acetylglucosamine synthase-like glycosyltransferase